MRHANIIEFVCYACLLAKLAGVIRLGSQDREVNAFEIRRTYLYDLCLVSQNTQVEWNLFTSVFNALHMNDKRYFHTIL